MSGRSLGRKKHRSQWEELGRKDFADGKPCPGASPDKGVDHTRRRGWLRAQAEARKSHR